MKTPFDASPFFISITAYYALSLPEYGDAAMHTHDSCEISVCDKWRLSRYTVRME